VDILEVGREYTKNLPLALSIGFVFLYLIISITSSNLFVLDSQATLTGQEGGQFHSAHSAVAHYMEAGLNNISLQIITYPLELLTDFNKLFLILGSSFTSINGWEGGEYLNESISNNFITIINSIINPIGLDINFVNFLQIEMLGQGLYTYGAYWLILSSIILLLSMIAPIILSTPASNT